MLIGCRLRKLTLHLPSHLTQNLDYVLVDNWVIQMMMSTILLILTALPPAESSGQSQN